MASADGPQHTTIEASSFGGLFSFKFVGLKLLAYMPYYLFIYLLLLFCGTGNQT